jgi:myosin heavy subunit
LLLQVDKDLLIEACTKRTVKPGGGKPPTQYPVVNLKSAINYRDTVARMVYDRLFIWIIEQASKNLFEGASEHNDVFIGVLDIFGFEFYENHQIRAHDMQVVNGLDQLNINICNEMLQQQFVKVNITFLY